jgi:hypothetical protein
VVFHDRGVDGGTRRETFIPKGFRTPLTRHKGLCSFDSTFAPRCCHEPCPPLMRWKPVSRATRGVLSMIRSNSPANLR